ncbi:MAG: hypothetical protein NC403_01455 [Muribaculaceae bacterium]|nr:hypothetical protein [Muribaculaceae bacterium]
MTTEEKDRLEIVKEMCSLQDCTLQEIYDFIKNGKVVAEQNSTGYGSVLSDGIYVVYADGKIQKFPGERLISTDAEVTGIAIKQGERALTVALHDADNGNDVTLTVNEDTTDYDGYIDTYIDAVADWNGKTNTEHLKEIGLNPAIKLKDGEYIPSVAEMYLIYTNRKAINAALRFVGGQEIPGKWYLTSTEGSATDAWHLHLSNGNLGSWRTKASSKGRVRPVSAFKSIVNL